MKVARIAALPLAATAACSRTVAQRSDAGADSLVLERTLCYGTCPAYRLSLTAAGRVTFTSRNPGEATRAADAVPRQTLADLVRRAEAVGFFELPAKLETDRSLCEDLATDHPTVTVTIFRAAGVKSVEDYRGCFARPDHSVTDRVARLRAFENAIDSATGSRRWVRPARIR